MQNSNSISSKHSFKLIQSKTKNQIFCHGTCISEQENSITLNRSRKYTGIESNYSKKNISIYLKEVDTKFIQPKSQKPTNEQSNKEDASKRYSFFHMRQQSNERFQISQTAIATKQAIENLKQGLNRVRSANSIA